MPYDPFLSFTADAIAPPESVVAQTSCHKITLIENGSASQDYQVRKVSISSNAIKRMAGTPFTFTSDYGSAFKPGDVVGFIETLAGSVQFAQIEEW